MTLVKHTILPLASLLFWVMIPLDGTLLDLDGVACQKCPECPSGRPVPSDEHLQSHLHEWPLYHCHQIRKMRTRLDELERENHLMKQQLTYLLSLVGEGEFDS